MRLGLGRELARAGEPDGDELRESRLGSSSSISSTSSCSRTSWSRMHLTEYWPNAESCRDANTDRLKFKKKGGFPSMQTNLLLLTSCFSSFWDPLAWKRGLQVHRASTSLQKHPLCRLHMFGFKFFLNKIHSRLINSPKAERKPFRVIQVKKAMFSWSLFKRFVLCVTESRQQWRRFFATF